MRDEPAFPILGTVEQMAGADLGMTLRDYFAAKAMQGYIVSGITVDSKNTTVDCCYEWADAMLAEREK